MAQRWITLLAGSFLFLAMITTVSAKHGKTDGKMTHVDSDHPSFIYKLLWDKEKDMIMSSFEDDDSSQSVVPGASGYDWPIEHTPFGSLTPCKNSGYHFDLSYTPTTLKRGGSVTVNFSFTPRVSMTSGSGCFTAKWGLIKKKKCVDFDCTDINRQLPGLCPFKNGKSISIRNHTFNIPKGLEELLFTELLDAGKNGWASGITVNAKVTVDIKNSSGQPFFCANGKVRFKL